MAYIGNDPNQEINSFVIGVDKFSGTGACTEFQLSRDIDDSKAIEVVLNGVQQTPENAYSVSNGLITFTEPPSFGSDNIVVTYRAPIVVTYNQIDSSQILPLSVTESKIADEAVTTNKIGDFAVTGVQLGLGAVSGNNIVANAIRGNNIVAGTITGNLIASSTIAGNAIGTGQITGNLILSNTIAGNAIGTGQVTGNLIASSTIAGNAIIPLTITGNLIGTGAISANNFAGGGITSNVLASNLSISVSRISETININSTPIGSNTSARANVNIDVLNTTVYLFSSNTSGNVTLNLRGNNTTIFDQAVQVGNTISVVVTLRHNVEAHRSGVNVAIDGGYIQTTRSNPDLATGNIIFYAANTTANHSPISALESNVIGLTVVKKAANSYIVYMSQTLYGLA